ncbi:uncharacterized protein LOC121598957 isoform X2 [Anopheles merus]|uniref:uncharacterized protein LOC121598957 isoform X2 n=1 Tax=Anopheles merus TaxID=30066 RepID=UPI001BE42986|nr:uncharacterized protein LOC121598957 isoform X2 [Anopheles merus]
MSKVKVHSSKVQRLESVLKFTVTGLTLLLLTVPVMTVQQEDNSVVTGGPTAHHHHPHHHTRHQRHQFHRDGTKQQYGDIGDDGGGDGDGGGGGGGIIENFLLIDYLNDGERERRLHWNGVVGKETSLADSSSNKTLSLWQMATHKYLMQIIYNSEGQMMDCEYVRQRDMLHQFRGRFFAEFAQARARNFSSGQGGPQTVDRASLVSNHDFRQYLEHDIVTPEMEELQYNVYEFPAGVPAAQQTIDAFGMRNLTYIPLRAAADIPAELLEQLNFQQLKQRCNVRHMQLKEIATGLRSADPEHKRIANEKLQRHKRAISDWFLSPNTKWCGKGHSASEYRQLGGASRADMCCRTHDHCKYMIPPMSTNFQTFNIRPFTISHCACDSRFRTCLKLADSKDANLVGKLFFNVMQMKCFVFKPETVCTKKSWWGTCERKGRRKRAVLRHNRKF